MFLVNAIIKSNGTSFLSRDLQILFKTCLHVNRLKRPFAAEDFQKRSLMLIVAGLEEAMKQTRILQQILLRSQPKEGSPAKTSSPHDKSFTKKLVSDALSYLLSEVPGHLSPDPRERQ